VEEVIYPFNIKEKAKNLKRFLVKTSVKRRMISQKKTGKLSSEN